MARGTTAQLLSVRSYAKRRGVSHTAVQRAIREGRLRAAVHRPRGGPPRLDADVADAEWDDSAHPGMQRGGSAAAGESGDDYRRALTLERVVKTRLAQMEHDERAGKLVKVEEVRATFFDLVRSLRDQMLELPDRLSAELALEQDPTRVQRILSKEVREILTKFADACRDKRIAAEAAAAASSDQEPAS